MKFLNKLERKFGRYAVDNLIVYIIGLYLLGVAFDLFLPGFYHTYLMLDFDMVKRGQIWRLVTFLIQPVNSNLIFLFFTLYLYFMIGRSLENAWGAFRFNLYFFSGVIFNILAAFVIYLVTGHSYVIPLDYINDSMFFAFAAIYPNVELLFMMILPVKIKYLAYIYAAVLGYTVIVYIKSGTWFLAIAILLAVANFLIYFFATRRYSHYSPRQVRRKASYRHQIRNAHNPDNIVQFRGKTTVTRHKCAVCGRTELDDPDLEFRFCSKCDGNYEYCMDHLYTHEHVHKDPVQKDSKREE